MSYQFFRFLLRYLVHAHVRSAKTRSMSGMKKQSTTFIIVLPRLLDGMAPMSSFDNGALRLALEGRSLWLHFCIMVPSFSSSNPGLLRMMVLSVVSSVKQNGYSAPVMSAQWSMSFFPEAVRQ